MKRFFLKTLFSSVDGENDALWKRWHHQNGHDRAPDHSTVSIQNGRQTLPCGVVVWTGEYDTKTISVDTNHFENEQNGSGFVWKRSKTAPFSFEKRISVDTASSLHKLSSAYWTRTKTVEKFRILQFAYWQQWNLLHKYSAKNSTFYTLIKLQLPRCIPGVGWCEGDTTKL